jgi:hypothetical protein
MTQDEDFLVGEPVYAVVVISRVRQPRPSPGRMRSGGRAIAELLQNNAG